MPISEQFKALLNRFYSKKRMRRTEASSNFLHFLETSKAVAVLVFVGSVAAIVLTSFVGIKSSNYQFLPNQQATIRIVAAETFSFHSKLLTERERENLLTEVPQVFDIDMAPYLAFEKHLNDLVGETEDFALVEEDFSARGAEEYVAKMAEQFNAKGSYRLSPADLATIIDFADVETRRELIDTGLISLRESYKIGIYDRNDASFNFGEDSVALFQRNGKIVQNRLESIEDALTTLRIALNAENVPQNVAAAFIRLFRDGVQPNFKRDETEMEQIRQKMLEAQKPVIVRVPKGESIIEPNSKVTPEQYEKYLEYRKHMGGKEEGGFDIQLVGRVVLVLAMLIAATFYIRLEDKETLKSNTRLGLLALVLILNLFIVRLCFEIGSLEQFIYNADLSAILPYITPTVLAPLTIAILMGTGPGLLTALMISLFSAVMFGNRLDLLVMSFLASTAAIFVCRNLRKRGRVVTGGAVAGLCIAVFTLLFNLVDKLPGHIITYQVLSGLITGIAEGVVVVGILPILEGLFKRTTDITLLELSDYNHPLLRRMQLEAPGTWHHSLMVANLAENASNAIGVNALQARVCCMYHDIGKMIKPEYFTENQLDGRNPHDEKTPSFSALIIKSHVKEGVDLGLTYKLPRPVIDVIRQHHGTNLIRYFFHKAKQQAESGEREGAVVQESTYRYDGPKPQFKESAVILLADSIEAASRSLAKVTPQNVEELIDRIVKANIEDGQLDDCPITMSDLAKIKESFQFTLLNSLHTRIAYPGGKNEAPVTNKKPNERKPERVEAGAGR